MTMEAVTEPRSAATVGRVLDLDSHEMVPVEMFDEIFDAPPAATAIAMHFQKHGHNSNSLAMPDLAGDVTPITYDSVWNLKGPYAPSAIDLARRPAVMDEMGVDRQLVYPTFGLMGTLLYLNPQAHEILGFDPNQIDRRQLGRECIDAHNRWAARITKTTSARARPVGIVPTDSIDEMMRQTEQLLADGVRALMIPATNPPGDASPAAPQMDPFWRLAAEADIPVTIHLGTEAGFLASSRWSAGVDAFRPSDKSTLEFSIEAHRAVTVHYAAENYLATMVLGGVFERHPRLRFGVIELTAYWVGPLAERLDLWVEKEFSRRFAKVLSMRPSEYIARNVRVTPFPFEPVDLYFERYPGLASVFSYATDYPHFEGGKESLRVLSETLSKASPAIRDQFFYQNGALLLPE